MIDILPARTTSSQVRSQRNLQQSLELDTGDADRLVNAVATLNATAVVSMLELPHETMRRIVSAGTRIR
ncbi:hypothetical protein [Curtobacterium sp. USHLN213]|uniref:hypothetical protein n=1 Tax=Curtobacterium sp. USHLN213 TaxID=3081255 RepID=UPI00301A7195